MVKRSLFARVPPVPVGWLTKSCPTPRDFPFERLLPGELRFFKGIVGRSLFSKGELVDLLHACFGDLVSSFSDDSLGGNLFLIVKKRLPDESINPLGLRKINQKLVEYAPKIIEI
jgi:hypothetical protein